LKWLKINRGGEKYKIIIHYRDQIYSQIYFTEFLFKRIKNLLTKMLKDHSDPRMFFKQGTRHFVIERLSDNDFSFQLGEKAMYNHIILSKNELNMLLTEIKILLDKKV
jgi:hypothetical protein